MGKVYNRLSEDVEGNHQQLIEDRQRGKIDHLIETKQFGDGGMINPSMTSSTQLSPINNSDGRFTGATSSSRRTWTQRTFSSVGAGSVRGSIFALCASAIGSGVLSLPYVLVLNGYALGILFLCNGAIASTWSNKIIAKMAIQENLNSYSSLALRAGGPGLARALQLMIMVYVFGSCVSY